MAKKPRINKKFIVRDLETLKVLSDPLRMEILRFISIGNLKGRLITVKEIAEELDMPNTKLYYHINLLEKHGLILVGDTQIVSGIIEKQYQIVAEDISVDKQILATDEGAEDEQYEQVLETISELLDSAYTNLKKSMKTILLEKLVEKEGGPPARDHIQLTMSSSDLFLTEKQAADMRSKVNSLVEEYERLSSRNHQKDTDALHFGCTLILSPHYHRSPNPDTDQPTQGATE